MRTWTTARSRTVGPPENQASAERFHKDFALSPSSTTCAAPVTEIQQASPGGE